MELNTIFYAEDYDKAYRIALLHDWSIKEIDPDEKGRRFKLIERPKQSREEIIQNEILELKSWFNTYYTEHEQKYRRLNLLGLKTDENADSLEALKTLYIEAEAKRKHIQELEAQLQ